MYGFGRGGGWGRAALFSGVASTPPARVPSGIEQLRTEKEDLEQRLHDLEERVKGAP